MRSHFLTRDGAPLHVRSLNARTAADQEGVLHLLTACTASDRAARFSGIRATADGIPWLLPRTVGDLAYGAYPPGQDGDLAAVVNLNADRNGTLEVAILVAPIYRKRNVGYAMLRLYLPDPSGVQIVASIDPWNIAACSLANKLRRSARNSSPRDSSRVVPTTNSGA
jgi:hypothetical protein